MNISEKFQKGEAGHTYTRIDSTYSVDIFLGYNNDGQMSMAVEGPCKDTIVKSSKFIDTKLNKRSNGDYILFFDLLDPSFKSLFYIFCKDMIDYCEKNGCVLAVSSAITRWKYWKEMFGKKKQSLLSKNEIKGLIGELLELKDHFIHDYGDVAAVESWMGPLLGHKDFEINDTWFEVKSVNENALQVKISSLEQLDSDIDGHLVVVRLEDASNVSKDAINLNSIVCEVADEIIDVNSIELFINKLDNLGYSYDDEYNDICFAFKGKEYYKVNDDFPRLTRKCVNSAIGNVEYTILLNGITGFKEVI